MTTNLLRLLMLGFLTLGLTACNEHSGHGHRSHSDHGGDHSHGENGKHGHGTEQGRLEPISLTLFGETLQLYMEYPPLIKGQKARFLAHFSVLETGEPIREGKLIVELSKPGAKPFQITIDEPKRDGLFVPVLEFGSAARYRAKFRIESPQVSGVIDIGELLVHENEKRALENVAHAESDPHDAIPFLMEQQWKIGMRLAKAHKMPLSERLTVPATVEPSPGGEVVVSIPLPGRLKPTEGGDFITAGKSVEKGAVLAVLELSPEVANRVRQAKVKRNFAQRKFRRVSQIRKKGVGSEKQFEQAKQELELAEAEYQSLLGNSEAVQLLSDKQEKTSSDSGLALPIVAPVSGEIVSAEQREGAYVPANEEIFRVLNSEVVWIEARVSEFDVAKLSEPVDAVLTLDAKPEKSFSIPSLGGRLVSVGTRVDPSSRTVSIRYELPNSNGSLKIGMFGTVSIAVEPPTPRLSIPRSAVIYENGVPTVYVVLSGESFQKREIKLGVKDQELVEVLEGLTDGIWVVSDGAYAVKLASASPASFGHGHAH